MSDDSLPYGGDLQAAIRAQDREAVRTLLVAQNEASSATPEKPSAEEEDEQCSCPICHELLFKPTVNSCGHAFCFWCMHHSMDALAASACPLCRAPFQHLPAPCLSLYQHIQLTYPEEAARRDSDMKAREESEFHASSPALDEIVPASSPVPDWRCVACGTLPRRPLVSVCGCITCDECEAQTSVCPRCDARRVFRPKVCRLVLAILGLDDEPLDAESHVARGVHEEEEAEAAGGPLPCFQAVGRAAASSGPGPSSSSAGGGSPGAACSAGGGTSAMSPPPEYTFFGIGCDACGAYPICGRAFRCCDCPEQIGYDLCESCHRADNSGLSRGRFGQAHRPEHRMEERPQERTWLHVVQAANPTLGVREILTLSAMAFAAEPEDEADEGEPPRPPPS